MLCSKCRGGSGDDTIKESKYIVGDITTKAGGTVICSVDDIKDYKYMVIQNYNGGSGGSSYTNYSGYTTIIPISLLLYNGVYIQSWMDGYYNTCLGQIYREGTDIKVSNGRGYGGGGLTLHGNIYVYR